MLTLKRLKEVLNYDPTTGVFTWKGVPGRSGKRSVGKTAGSISTDGYNVITIDRKQYRSARLAWLYMTGHFPIPTVDHKNRIRTDDRFDNLKEATVQEQRINQRKYKDNGLPKNVFRVKEKYQVCIKRNGKRKYFGNHITIDDAVVARNIALKQMERNIF